MRTFVDTNILFYAHDGRAPTKERIALERLGRLREDRDGVFSTQVLNELCSLLLRKFLLPPPQVKDLLALYDWMEVVVVQPPQHVEALDLVASHRLNYWDALMVVAAALGNCRVLLSEDLQHGQVIRGVRIENPFT